MYDNIVNFAACGDLASLMKCAVQLKQSVHKYLPDGRTYLIAACKNGQHDVAQYLIDVHDADVLQVGTVDLDGELVEGVTPLWCASASGNLKLVKLLVSRGADVNQTTTMNSTALRAACFGGHEEIVEFLVEHGADIEIPNCRGHTCLMISCYQRHDRIVKYLLENNARVNRRSDKGSTALHDCAEIGYIEGIKLLLEYGAKMYTDENGQSPIICAANAGLKKVVDYLASLTKWEPEHNSTTSLFDVNEISAAYYILGASLFDRHHSIPEAIFAWNHAMNLRNVNEQTNLSNSDCKFSYPTKRSFLESMSLNILPAALQAVARMENRIGVAYQNLQTHNAACSTVMSNNWLVSASNPLRCSESSLDFHRKKYSKLQSDLRAAYLFGTQKIKYNVRKIDQNQACSETRNSSNCATTIDPILCLEPLVEDLSNYRQWSFNQDFNSSSSLHFSYKPRKHANDLKQCPSCQLVLFPFGTSSNSNECPTCKRMLSTNDSYVVWPHNRKSMGSPSSNANTTSKITCSCCPMISEHHPLIQRFKTYMVDAFSDVHEFHTMEQLDDMTRDPQVLCLQPLLIRLRILGPGHPEVNRFIRDAIYTDTNNIRKCLKIWRFVVTYQHIFCNPLGLGSQTSFASLAELFLNILTESCSAVPAADLDPGLIVDCLELAVDNLKWAMEYSSCQFHTRYQWSYTLKDKDSIDLTRNATLCLNLIAMVLTHYAPESKLVPTLCTRSQLPKLSKPISKPNTQINLDELVTEEMHLGSVNSQLSLLSVSPSRLSLDSLEMSSRFEGHMSSELSERFFYQVFRLVQLNPRLNQGLSLVHLSCSPETTTVGRFELCHFPRVDILDLLLKLGANPNLPDAKGQRPIGYILSHPFLKTSDRVSLLKTLVHGGAHLDVCTPTGISILDNRCRTIVQESKLCLLNHINLACLAAQVAKRNGLTSEHPFVRTNLTEDLIAFIEMH